MDARVPRCVPRGHGCRACPRFAEREARPRVSVPSGSHPPRCRASRSRRLAGGLLHRGATRASVPSRQDRSGLGSHSSSHRRSPRRRPSPGQARSTRRRQGRDRLAADGCQKSLAAPNTPPGAGGHRPAQNQHARRVARSIAARWSPEGPYRTRRTFDGRGAPPAAVREVARWSTGAEPSLRLLPCVRRSRGVRWLRARLRHGRE